MKNNTIKKLTALLLALLLLAGLMPAAGYADELPAAQTEAAAGASQASAAPDADETDEAEDVSAEPDEEPAAETDGGSGQPAAEPQTDERIRVVVVSEIEDLRVTVYPAPTEETPEPEAIEPEEDGSWLLAAGDYVYSAEAENYISLEKVAFTLTAEASPVYELHPEMTPVTETADAAEKSETAKEDVTGAKAGEADGNHAEEPAAERLRAPADEPVGSAEIVDSGTCDDGLSWTLTADGTLTVSGNGAMRDNMSPRPPWKDFAAKVKHIVIENGVTKVGQSNFDGLPNLLTVTVADSVTEMSSHCICNCPSLTDVKLPKNLRR